MDFYFSGIQLILVGQGQSASARSKDARQNNLLLYKTSGTTYYKVGESTYCLRAGDIIFVPDGASYSVKTTVSGGYIAVIFKTESRALGGACKLKLSQGDELFSRLFRIANGTSESDRLRCNSLFFDILYRLSVVSDNPYVSPDKKKLAESAAEDMEKNYSNIDFRLSEMYLRYGISNVYFCKIFKQVKGMTPMEYLAEIRLKKSKDMLLSGASVTETAAACGFADPLYFSKFFKKHMGIPPTAYAEMFSE